MTGDQQQDQQSIQSKDKELLSQQKPVSPPVVPPRVVRRWPWIVVSVVLFIVLLVVLVVGGWYIVSRQNKAVMFKDGNSVVTDVETSIADVVEKVSPSVVSIVTDTTQRTFYGSSRAQAAGTGVIISVDGYVLTNRHVVANASKVEVVLNDGTTYSDVKVVGSDPLNDIAYLKIAGVSDLRAAEIGNSATTRVGQSVIAIGNALGQYQNTVSSGIVSGKGRSVLASSDSGSNKESLTDMIQTDAAINSGNSGGPLLNYTGQVIGINTAVASDATGIGFSIPINATKGTMKSVLAGKGVQRAYIGIRYVDITPALAKQHDLSVTQGTYVTSDNDSQPAVQVDSPAVQVGIREKDILTKVDDVAIDKDNGFSSLIGQYQPGEKVKLTIIRGNRELTAVVTLATYSN